jgi:hypothetical protein
MIRKMGVWLFICGVTIVPFAIQFESSIVTVIALLLGLFLIGVDLMFTLRDIREERGGLIFYLPHAIAFGSLLIFYLRTLLPVESSDFAGRLGLFLLILFLIMLSISILLRLALHAGREALLASTSALRVDRGRSMRDALLSTITALLVFTAVNYFVAIRNPVLDLTPGNYSFGDESTRIIRSLPGKIEIHAFLPVQQATKSSGTERYAPELFRVAEDIRIMLDQLPLINPGIHLVFHNADLEGDTYGDFGPVTNGTIVFRALKRDASVQGKPYSERRVYVYGESELGKLEKESLRALVQISSQPKTVYFTAANGERWHSFGPGSQPRGIETLKNELTFYNYSVKALDTDSGWPGPIPTDASAVIIVGPVVPFSDVAKRSLIDYMSRSGRLFVAIDPEGREPCNWLLSDAFRTAIRFHRDRFTTLPNFPGIVFTDSTEKHRTTENLKIAGRGMLIFPGSGYFEVKAKKSEMELPYTVQEIVHLTHHTFIDRNGDGKPDTKDGPGSLPLALAFESKSGAKAVLLASTEWLTEYGLRFPMDNRNIILAADSLFWLTESPIAAAVRSEIRTPRTVQITPESKFRNILFGIFLFPLFVVAATGSGVYIYRRRRFHREADE